MKKYNWRMLIGALLVAVGLLSFLNILTDFPFWGILWGSLFGVTGIAFLVYSRNDQKAWWALIPGVILLGLSILILSSVFFPRIGGAIGGFIFLGSVSLAFWLVYLRNKNFWWAIIPGGVFGSLSLVTLVDEFTRFDGGFVFLFGLAVTFALLAILPGMPGNRNWPWIPAGILALVSFFTIVSSMNQMGYVLSFLFIGLGLFLIVRNFVKK
jgi:uncharacterized membrane protein